MCQGVTQEAAACLKFPVEVPETRGGVSVTQAQGESFNEKDENPLVGLGLKFYEGENPQPFLQGLSLRALCPLESPCLGAAGILG